MSESISLGKTTHFWRIVALRSDCQLPFRKTSDWPIPTIEKVENHRDCWSGAGEQADSVAQYLQDCLDRLSEGWKGKGAKAFQKKVDQVIYFARMLAYQCDSQKYAEPQPPEDDKGDGPSGPQAPTPTSGKGYVQIWDGILDALRDAKEEDKNPTYPWCSEQYSMYSGVGFPAGLFYEIYNSSGDTVKLPAWNDETSIDEADLWVEYNKCWGRSGDRPDPLVDSGHLVMDTVDDISSTQVTEDGTQTGHTFFPANDKRYEEFFVHMGLNKGEAATSRETIAALLETYGKVSEEPDPPEAPKLFSEEETGGSGSSSTGGASGPGGGSMGGGPGSPSTGGPNPDEIGGPSGPGDGEDTDIPGPRDTNEQRDTLDRRDRGPNSPDRPGGPDGPNGPGEQNTGFPGPDQRDTGTETARVGGGPGTIGGGPGSGGPGSGMIGGGPGGGPGSGGPGGAGGSNLPGTPGAGLAAGPGRVGGMGGGMGGAGGGMGMMPMGGGGMGGGAGEGGGEGDRDTWLDEDEDVWGANPDAPPPVLGGSL